MIARFSLVALVLFVAGCSAPAAESPSPSAPSPSPTAVPSPSPTEQPSVEPATPSGSPNPSPAADPDIGPWTGIRVTADGLAVRTGPGATYPMLAAYRWMADSSTEELATDALRIDAGHYLFAEHGPLMVEGIPWFLVANVQQADETPEETLRWDADGNEFRGDYGWIAGTSAEGDAYLVAEEIPPPPGPVHGPVPEPYLRLASTGPETTAEFAISSRVIVRWFAIDPEGGSCAIEMTAEPTGEVLASFAVDGITNGETIFPAQRSTDGVYEGMMAIGVDSDCTWSVIAAPEAG